MDAEHEIFNKPFNVDLTWEVIDTPENYRSYYDGKDLPPQLEAWRVHGELRQKDYGLVSDPYGFTDSPDCEYISSGYNSKGPKSVALGRQGNWFLWGFCASPGDMTGEAKLVYVNTIVYMTRFDGQAAYGKRKKRARQWALQYTQWINNEQAGQYYRQRFSPELFDYVGGDAEKFIKLLEYNLEYIYQDAESRFIIDEDAKALGLPNRSPELLEKCISLLEEGSDMERAERLLRRYTGLEFEDSTAWRRWYRENRSRLYFTDTGGYLFKVRPY